MENFFYGDTFFSDLTECCEYNEWTLEEIEEYPDDFKLEVECSVLEPIFRLSVDWIIDRINDERFSEDGDEVSKIVKILEDNINFDKINEQIPQFYYGSRKKHYFSKSDLLEAVS